MIADHRFIIHEVIVLVYILVLGCVVILFHQRIDHRQIKLVFTKLG